MVKPRDRNVQLECAMWTTAAAAPPLPGVDANASRIRSELAVRGGEVLPVHVVAVVAEEGRARVLRHCEIDVEVIDIKIRSESASSALALRCFDLCRVYKRAAELTGTNENICQRFL